MSEIAGFPELTVSEEIVMQRVIQEIKVVYQSYGYGPLETRLVEYADVLESKGIDGKEVYALARLRQDGADLGKETKRLLALRFDLTVPLARFVAQNTRALAFPFKRYQVQKVYRGEAAKENTGRFREFYQSDIDVIGANGKLSLLYDSEFPAVIYEIFRNVLSIERFVMRINNRKLLEGLFAFVGVNNDALIKGAIKAIDNMEKVPTEKTVQELEKVNISTDKAKSLLDLFTLCRTSDPVTVIRALAQAFAGVAQVAAGIAELGAVVDGIVAQGVPTSYFRVDLSIARGLDYYSGTVYETNLLDHLELGSVCSGGRYEELVGTLSSSNVSYPGCGISIGLSRLVPTLIRNGYLKADTSTTADVLVTTTADSAASIQFAQELAATLRTQQVKASVYYNSASLKAQLKYASSCGFPYVIINTSADATGTVIVRNMQTGEQAVTPLATLCRSTFAAQAKKEPSYECVAPVMSVSVDELAERIQRIMK